MIPTFPHVFSPRAGALANKPSRSQFCRHFNSSRGEHARQLNRPSNARPPRSASHVRLAMAKAKETAKAKVKATPKTTPQAKSNATPSPSKNGGDAGGYKKVLALPRSSTTIEVIKVNNMNSEYYGKLKVAWDAIIAQPEFDGIVEDDAIEINDDESEACGHQSTFDQFEFETAVKRTGLYKCAGLIPWGNLFKPAIGGVPVSEYQVRDSPNKPRQSLTIMKRVLLSSYSS